MHIDVTRDVVEAMLSAARSAHPQEACGILLGRGGHITRFIETRNVHPAPQSHFEIDPQALIDVHRDARTGDLDIAGYFHSHPKGEAMPSVTDEELAAADGSIWAIQAQNDLRFFRSGKAGFEALSMRVIDG